jgi:TusA-related sulfurtransferase
MVDDKSQSIKPDFSLDMRGYFCPEPVFRTRQKILDMNTGEILEVLADDPVAEEDIKSWIKKTGHDLIFFNKTEKLLKFLICKIK